MEFTKTYKIIDVLDKETNKTSPQWSYRIGRVGFIKLLDKGKGLVFLYPNNKCFRTSIVEDYKIDFTGTITIETKNRIYKLAMDVEENKLKECA